MELSSWYRFANMQLPAKLAVSLLEAFGDPGAVFAASREELQERVDIQLTNLDKIKDSSYLPTDPQLRYLDEKHITLLPYTSEEYPVNLRDIPDPPALLFVRGNLEEKDRFAVAIVGSRRATPYGKSIAGKLARDVSNAGLTVVSGGALGIDSAAHNAVVMGGGRTIVVLGCGMDIEYPRENLKMFDRIATENLGAVISEYPLAAQPEGWRFPQRNRIISGLSIGVTVVEAGLQSGALRTASIALEQGREVMAVPGNVDKETSRGTNGLIKDGAALVETAHDIMRSIGMFMLEPVPAQASLQLDLPAHGLPEGQRRLLESLSLTPKHIDALAADVRMTSTEVSVQMTLLELSGLVRRLPGNCYIRVL